MLTTKELHIKLKLHPETIREWSRKGKIPAMRTGRTWKFDYDEVVEALKEQQKKKG